MEPRTLVPESSFAATDLENAIAAYAAAGDDHDGQARRNVFAHLVTARVTTLFAEPVPEEPRQGSRIQICVVSDGPDTGQPMVAVFTSRERAEDFVSQHEGERYPGEVSGLWAILATAPGAGLLINPNQPAGFRIAPELAKLLREDIRQAATDKSQQQNGELDS